MAPKRKPTGKGKPEAEKIITGEEALALKAALDAGQSLDDATLLKLLHADKPCEGLYSKACKGKTSGNPNCLCTLIPAPGAHRRAGLWCKVSDAAGLGADPSDRRRAAPAAPAGLRNLGNTCYANSVLQCLAAIPAFRHAVYAVGPPVGDDPAVAALRELFAGLELGPAAPVDPAPLMEALQIDHAVQQDGQEFMKLLLTMLEGRFAGQGPLRGVIPSLFRGQSGYETTCLACARPSEASARRDGFYELDVPVRGTRSLGEALEGMRQPETLDGDNQYFCEGCGGKRDAARRLRVAALPPLLCFSLQRFLYDWDRNDRVKASDRFAFPLELRADALVDGDDPGAGALYDLQAILIHKGGSAMQGHYVAHIKLGGAPDGAGGAWWRFDDDAVTAMPEGPLGSADHGGGGGGGAGGKKKEKEAGGKGSAGRGRGKGKGKGRGGRGKGKEKEESEGEGEAEEVHDEEAELRAALEASVAEQGDPELAQALAMSRAEAGAGGSAAAAAAAGPSSSAKPGAGAVPAEIVSSNAYLLVYRRRGEELSLEAAAGPAAAAAAEAFAAAAKARLATAYEEECATYTTAKAEAEARQAARREEVRRLIEAAAGGAAGGAPGDGDGPSAAEAIAAAFPPGDPGRFVSAAWLAGWADAPAASAPDPIDNAPLLCPHGRLDPSRPGAMRRLPTHVWAQLADACKGGPELRPSDACPTCLAEVLDAVAAAEDAEGGRERYLALAEAILGESGGGTGGWPRGAAPPAFYVSRAWLAAWVRREGRSLGSKAPTADLECPHGGMAPDPPGSKAPRRVAVPADFWGFLRRGWALAAAEKGRKARAKAAEWARKVSGGAAVLHGGAAAAAAPAVKSGGDDGEIEVMEVDGVLQQGGGEEPKKEEDLIEILDEEPPAAAAAGAAAEEEEDKPAAGPADPLPEFSFAADECPLCRQEQGEAARLAKDLNSRQAAEREALAHLLSPAPAQQLAPGSAFRLVPRAFMDHWRAYMTQTAAGRRAAGGAAVGAAAGAGSAAAAAAAAAGAILDPPSLREYLSGAVCGCHGDAAAGGPLLAFAPPPVVNRRGRWVVAGADAPVGSAAAAAAAADPAAFFELLAPADWDALLEHYGDRGMAFGEEGITATLRVEAPPVATPPAEGTAAAHEGQGDRAAAAAAMAEGDGAAEAAPAAAAAAEEGGGGGGGGGAKRRRRSRPAALSPSPAGSDGELEVFGHDPDALYDLKPRGGRGAARPGAAGRAWLDPAPAVCAVTLAEREAALKAARLSYFGAEIMVETSPTDEEAAAATAASAAPPAAAPAGADVAGERKSKRARKGRAPVAVDCTTTLHELRLRVYQALGVHPRNARLFIRGVRLGDGDEATLAACEVYPGEELRVVDTGEHDADDLTGLFGSPGCGARGGRGREGFGGTALTGLHPGGGASSAEDDVDMAALDG